MLYFGHQNTSVLEEIRRLLITFWLQVGNNLIIKNIMILCCDINNFLNSKMLKDKIEAISNVTDVVEVIATAFPDNKYSQNIRNQKISSLAENLNIEFIIPENLFKDNNHFFANDISIMKQNLENALTNCNSTILWAFKGGYGTINILSAVDKITKTQHSKILVGYSDLTALSIYLNLKWQWKTIHYHMLSHIIDKKNNIDNQEHFSLFKKIIFNKIAVLKYKIKPINKKANDLTSSLDAVITGGNLSVIQTLIGTIYQPDLKNTILILEDIGEKGYEVDRMLVHLQQAGIFKDITAVIFGDFICDNTKQIDEHCDIAINRFANIVDFPVLRIENIGHLDSSLPIVFGTKARISSNLLEIIL